RHVLAQPRLQRFVPAQLGSRLGVLVQVLVDPGTVGLGQGSVHVERQQFVESGFHGAAPANVLPPSRCSSSFRQFFSFWRAWNRRVLTVFSGQDRKSTRL